MMYFKKEDFFEDVNTLKKKYKYIDSGTEGYAFKVNEEVFAKKFYYPREVIVKETQNIILSTKPKKILVPMNYLIKNEKIYTAFSKFFDGESPVYNVGEIDFDILINDTKDILSDIRKLSESKVCMCDVTSSSLMYNKKEMILTDTTKYYIDDNYNANLYMDNLYELFYLTGLFYSEEWDKIVNQNPILKQLKLDFDNYNFFYSEFKKVLENVAETKVNCINEGLSIINGKKS